MLNAVVSLNIDHLIIYAKAYLQKAENLGILHKALYLSLSEVQSCLSCSS